MSRHVIGNVQINPIIIVQMGGDNSEAAAVGVDETSRLRDVDEFPIVIAEYMIGKRWKIAACSRACGDSGASQSLVFCGS